MMLTIADKIYPACFQGLSSAVNAIENSQPEEGSLSQLEAGYRALEACTQNAEEVQTRFFLDALSKRLKGDDARVENLYLKPDQGQQIKMFNLMAQKFPVVRHAQALVNAIFLDVALQEEHLLIFDVGIGTGQQVANLLERAGQENPPAWKRVTVLGIEPSSESIQMAESRLSKVMDELGLQGELLLMNKTVEQLSTEDWNTLQHKIADTPAKLLLNASFSLHHIKPVNFRTDVFKKLKAFNPRVFMIIEPYADFITPDLIERFQNAWHHYGLTFQAIDEIDASPEEKSSIKQIFFGREIQDVLAEQNRTEQFETAEMWIERLQAAGFQINALESHRHAIGPMIEEAPRNGYIGLNVQDQPIVAIIRAQ